MVGYTQFFDMGFLGSTLSLLIHVEKMGRIPILNPLSFIPKIQTVL
jgi:hypothetical protein